MQFRNVKWSKVIYSLDETLAFLKRCLNPGSLAFDYIRIPFSVIWLVSVFIRKIFKKSELCKGHQVEFNPKRFQVTISRYC